MTTPHLNSEHRGASPNDGAGSVEPATGAGDPDELRTLLERARERLRFHEGFDRVIAENVRRSGELMLETLSMRKHVAASGFEERERLVAGLAALDTHLDAVRAHLDSLASEVSKLRHLVGPAPDAGSVMEPVPVQIPDAPALASLATTISPSATWDTPQVVEVIAHNVTRAAVALSLQRYLGDLADVAGVEAREFAGGVLRMQVTARHPLGEIDIGGWTGNGTVTILQMTPTVIEIDLG